MEASTSEPVASKWELDTSEAAVSKKDACLRAYNKNVDKLKAEGQPKPDMVTFRVLREKYTPADMHGHVPGVKPGDKFNGRGELAILALHKKILAGIDFRNEDKLGAFAIVLSGGYKDDNDEGTTFWYTGQGGQGKGGIQVKDQQWMTGNLALRVSHETKTPVRVFRGGKHGGKAGDVPKYVYDGLYLVKEAKLEPSSDGPLVCKFLMEGLRDQSQASEKVEFGALGKGGRSLKGPRRLAAVSDGRKKKKAQVSHTEEGWELAKQARLKALSKREGLLVLDFSGGLEKVPIPVFNETGDGVEAPKDFRYIADYKFADGVEELIGDILKEQDDAFLNTYMGGEPCAVKFNKDMMKKEKGMKKLYSDSYLRGDAHNYSEEGRLMSTDSFGVIECGDLCGKRCARNKQVSRGVELPLEVFMTEHIGWGVRCDRTVYGGEFVCSYVGTVLTDEAAEMDRANQYLYDFNHFATIYESIETDGMEAMLADVPEHKIPPFPPLAELSDRVAARAAAMAARNAEVATRDAEVAIRDAELERSRALKAEPGHSENAMQEDAIADAVATVSPIPVKVVVCDSTTTSGHATESSAPKELTNPLESSALLMEPAQQAWVKAGGDKLLGVDVLGSMRSSPATNNEATISGPTSLTASGRTESARAQEEGMDPEPSGGLDGAGKGQEGEDTQAGEKKVLKLQDSCTRGASEVPAGPLDQQDTGTDGIPSVPMDQQDTGSKGTNGEKLNAASEKEEDSTFDGLLVVDAETCGNLARFINHSCHEDANLVIQPVFTRRSKNVLFYHIALFATRDIPKGEEFRYDYGTKYMNMNCQCGSKSCRGNMVKPLTSPAAARPC